MRLHLTAAGPFEDVSLINLASSAQHKLNLNSVTDRCTQMATLLRELKAESSDVNSVRITELLDVVSGAFSNQMKTLFI